MLQSIDYVHPDGNVVFRTCSKEKDKLVFQMVIIKDDRSMYSLLCKQTLCLYFELQNLQKNDKVTEYLTLFWLAMIINHMQGKITKI